MADQDQNLLLQAEEHPLVTDRLFETIEQLVLHLMHLRAYEEAATFATDKVVLDFGCNNGYGLKIVRPFALEVVGLDVSPQAVEAARRELGDEVEVELYDGRRSGLASERFDVVLSFQVVEHVADPEPYLAEIARLLKPGGIAIFTTPNAALRLDPGMKPWNRFHVREFSTGELTELLSPWFEKVDVQGMFAAPELDQVEKRRIERSKAQVRRPARRLWGAVRRLARSVLRERGRAWLRRVRRPAKPRLLDDAVLERFSTADLSYRAERVDASLDLMAVCRKAGAA